MTSIPKNIFQTHKSKEFIMQQKDLVNAALSWKLYQPEYNYYFYDDNDCDKFMREKMGKYIYEAYNKLPLAVMKADLFRYCIIYYYGGIYADLDTICKLKPELFINDSMLTIVPENETHLCQWVFSAPKGSPILKTIIDLSVERILQTKIMKGEHLVHYLTGPGIFTEGLELYLIDNNEPIFKNKKQYYKYPKPFLRVFNPNVFHQRIVIHLFAGQKEDGWFKEREISLL